MKTAMTGRVIGFRHRIKKTAKNEARPTQLVILDDGNLERLDLPSEEAEFDFIHGKFPTKMRKATTDDKPTLFLPHHLEWRTLKEGEDVVDFPDGHVRGEGKKTYVLDKVPAEFGGLREGDLLAMTLGGSGDYFAAAAARRGFDHGFGVLRVPPFHLAENRPDGTKGDKEGDAELLARLALAQPELFYKAAPRDLDMIRVAECQRNLEEALAARIACEQRLYQRVTGMIFCDPDGLYPEGGLKKKFEAARAADPGLKALKAEEAATERALDRALEALDVYQAVFKPIEGLGTRISARVLASIVDIRRFSSETKLMAYMGVHTVGDEEGGDRTFPRHRKGSIANWSPRCRQAMFLVVDQFNKRPESDWGKKLREFKVRLREKHPVEVVVDGKRRYTNGHIHRMATWRTATRFVRSMYRNWTRFERDVRAEGSESPPVERTGTSG